MILRLLCLMLVGVVGADIHAGLKPGAAHEGQQTRDTAPQPTMGKASISGVVVDDQDPARPIRRVVVTLTGAGLHPNRGAITDDEGRFTLRHLPAGRFTLMAERGGFITSIYGARRPGRSGTEIAIADGQQMDDLRVRLWRGAVLSGVLRDESGEPRANASVAAIPARQVTPVAATLSNATEARTNDLGEFRIFGLEPGTYVLRSSVEFPATEVAASEAEIDAAFAALAARGRQKGVNLKPVEGVPVSTTSVSAAPIYFPGTPVPADATPITVKAGEERSGLDFAVHKTRVAAIRGVVVGPDGATIDSAYVQLAANSKPVQFAGTAPEPATTYAAKDGTFTLSSISPGSYTLLARGVIARAAGGSGASGSSGWASVAVTITGDDVDVARLTLQPGMSVSGRVVIDDAATTSPPDLTALHVQIQPESIRMSSPQNRGRGGGPNMGLMQPSAVRADGTFTAADLVPDNYRITISGGAVDGATWWLRSATLKGRDLLDAPWRLSPGENISGLTLVLSDRRTQLSGTITTPAGAAFSDLVVLAYPAEGSLRGPQSRRIKAVRPDSRGRYVLENLPPGEYLLCALSDIDDGQWNDPGFLDAASAASIKITLADGEKRVQDLRLGR